nr:DUF1064 domain-containing protein [Aminobacter aminovorans]
MTKYKAQPVEIDGIRFASKLEGRFYSNLKLLERAGEVTSVELQKPFLITINGKVICTYRCDFAFFDLKLNKPRVVDTKGMDTPVFKLKRKLVEAQHGITIELVRAA